VEAPLTFVQMADPQFGQFAHLSGRTSEEIARYRRHGLNVRAAPRVTHFREETRRFETAVAMAGAARPRFVVVCGDMVNTAGDPEQVAEVKRIAAGLPGQRGPRRREPDPLPGRLRPGLLRVPRG
jgi:hypothetical protein